MKLFRTILTLSLVLLVLLSSTSFQVGLHFCKGEVREIAIFSKVSGCEKEKQLPPCHRHAKSSCCDDETVIHEADELSVSAQNIQLDSPAPLDAHVPFLVISEVIPASQASRHSFSFYYPPLRAGDLTVAYRTLII